MRLLREYFPGFMDDRLGTSYGSSKPKGSGRTWTAASSYPYKAPPAPADPREPEDNDDLDTGEPELIARFRRKVGGRGSGRRDMGQTRVDAGTFLGQAGTFNALAEDSSMPFMANSITPIIGFNRMTNRTQDPNDPVQIPNITHGPGVKHRTGTVYGTSHASFLASDDLASFNPGLGDVLPDRDERGLARQVLRFRDLMSKTYDTEGVEDENDSIRPNNVIVGEGA